MNNELKHIMLVEDEPDIREIAAMTLSELGGFKLTICDSGQKALEQLQHEKPQLIMLDVMMPGMDGPTTYEKIKTMKNGEKVPVIFMTARVQAHEVEGYLEQGAIGVISKPFNPTTLAQEVYQLWSKA